MTTETLPKPRLSAEEQQQEIFKDEKAMVTQHPLLLVDQEFLSIKTKTESIVKLKLNEVQRIVFNQIEKLFDDKKPIRLLVLKARQTGISTLLEAILYSLVSLTEGVNALVIADDIKGSNYIFEMQKLFHEKLEDHLKPMLAHSNEKKLEFEGIHSQVLIDTADNRNAGRKFTLRYVHLSEAAFFPDLESIMLGLSQSVPNAPGTMMILETTANGIGNAFHDRWVKASEGTSDWIPIFIPWFILPEYKMPLTGPELYPIDSIRTDRKKFIDEEIRLIKDFKLSKEQLNWRRWCIINNCNGELSKFRQEYPAYPEEAFLATGDLFFNKESMLLQKSKQPVCGNIVKDEMRYVFRPDETGAFRTYEMPVRGEQYVVAGDPAEGLEHGDKSAAVVLNTRTNQVACTCNNNAAPEDFEEYLVKLGNFYNKAMVACENKGYGYSINQGLFKRYGRVYRKVKSKKGFDEPTLELGWNTNVATRPTMLSQLDEEIRSDATDLIDKELIQQCWTFINNIKKKRPEASRGKCDDLVIARAIAGQLRLKYPYKKVVFASKSGRRRRGLSGY